MYDTLQLLAMAQRLSEPDIRVLGLATEAREAGLKAARDGDLTRGANLVAEARACYEGAAISAEARRCGETFQTAAESYIQYKEADFHAAEASMRSALADCERLAIDHGYPLEMRRVHLARNVAQVRSAQGYHHVALLICLRLLRYIAGDEVAWPFEPAAPGRRAHLKADAALLMLDQVLSVAARQLLADAFGEAHGEVNCTVELLQQHTEAQFRRAAMCLRACFDLADGKQEEFIGAAGAFFEDGRQFLESAWHALEGPFLACADRLRGTDVMPSAAVFVAMNVTR